MGAYFASLPTATVPESVDTAAELSTRGGELVAAGRCANCHLPNFAGQGEMPRLAGQREDVLVGLSTGKVTFEGGLPARVFWTTVYQTVMEGMFSDPIYGGNRDKAGWKMIGFPGVIEVNRENVAKYLDKPFPTNPLSIADMS